MHDHEERERPFTKLENYQEKTDIGKKTLRIARNWNSWVSGESRSNGGAKNIASPPILCQGKIITCQEN